MRHAATGDNQIAAGINSLLFLYAGALESIQVEFEGETYPLQELAQVGRKNPQMAVLSLATLPDAIKPVLKAIESCGMNLNPQQEGTTIYVPLPK